MEDILQQLIGNLSQYAQGFLQLRWCKIFFHQQYVSYTIWIIELT